MSIIQGNAHTSAGGGYQIERSLRFNSADSAYLNRTPASAGNRKTWTWSGWIKRSKLGGTYNTIFGTPNGTSDSTFCVLTFGANGVTNSIGFQTWNNVYRQTTQVFRDVGGWYHIILALDTTQATATNRIKLYVNGVQVTTFATSIDPSQNTDFPINAAAAHTIGRSTSQGVYFDGYMTEIYFINGQQLTPSDFGETDSNTGVWKPKAFSGTYGTNGFYLKFADNSGTTSTTLGKDSSGNGNNWTPNNFSVTAGAGNDSLVDTPTSYGTDTGVGGEVRGNYCTWNPLRPNAAMSYANGNLDATSNGGSGRSGYGTFGMSSGKWYFETTGGDNSVGVATVDGSVYAIYIASGSYNINGTTTSGKATYTTSDVIGCAYDADANTIEFFKNGSSQGSTSFSAAAGLSVVAQFNGTLSATRTCVANFGQRPFAYTAPSGFKALCTQNLPTPTIGATSTTQANDYFNAVTYTGNGATNNITGVGFQPDFVWLKDRTTAFNNYLYDAVRGTTKALQSNSTNAEETRTGLTAFGSDGFTLGSQGGDNQSGDSFVAWNWKANGAGSSNTAGTITSTVSANTTSGFSIVTYTGTGANATVGHGLGVAPSMIIIKARGSVASGNWTIYNKDIGATKYLYLNSTIAASTFNHFQNTDPTSSLFYVVNDGNVNQSSIGYVAYCFAPVAGYSAFGSYTGNGSSDGPFIYTGFRPRFVIRKCSSATSHWFINDAARDPSNVVLLRLNADLSDAESSGANSDIDFLSNGFKIRATSTAGVNQSGQTHIYMAFAETPVKYSLGR